MLINATFQPFQDDSEQAGRSVQSIPEGADAGSDRQAAGEQGRRRQRGFFELNATLTLRRGKLRTGNTRCGAT